MINYLSKFNYLSIKLITCQNILIADQKMIDYICQNYHTIATTVSDGLMFYRRCFLFLFFRHAFSEIPLPIALKLCHMVGIWRNFINWLQKFGGSPLKNFVGQKHAKFWSILDHFRLWSRISPESGNISKIGKTYELGKFLLRLMKKVRWTLDH